MAHPDEPNFDQFIQGVLNASFSSARDPASEPEDYEMNDVLLHNLSDSEPPSEIEEDNGAGTSTSNQNRPIRSNEWVDVTNTDTGPNRMIPIFNINSGPNLPSYFDEDTEPIDYFSLFFNNDFLQYICDETNHFANKRKSEALSPRSRLRKWNDITVDVLKAFLGTIINMGLIPLHSIETYFSTTWTNRIPFFSNVFSKDEFLNIFWNIHFNHADEQQKRKPGFLIRPIVDHMKSKCQLFYQPRNNVAVDESTISFKGKVSFRVYNPQKPVKFGMKVFVLSDCQNGYIYNFIPYFGKEDLIPNTTLLKTTQIVKVLAESVVFRDPNNPVTGLHIYTDRYYTSPELALELLKMNCNITGTVMTNRSGMPNSLKQKQKKMKKGDISSYRKEDTLVLSWRDKRVVTMLSTKSEGSKRHVTDVPSKWPNLPPTAKPNVVLDYTKHMGAVDRSDQFIASYQFMRKTKKWYRKMFFWNLEVAVVNSYLLYKEVREQYQKKPMTHIEFRQSLVKDLVAEKVLHRKINKTGRKPQGPPEERLVGRHFLAKKKKGTRCVVCLKKGLRKETVYYCKTCVSMPTLHPDDCFELFHTKTTY